MPTYTNDQLVALTSMNGLTKDQIEMRATLLKMKAEEVTLEKTAFENNKFQIERSEEVRRDKVKRQEILRAEAEDERIKGFCRHNTGGRDRAGWWQGSGEIFGRSVSKQLLPTGETYIICCRCTREWHHPNWIFKYYPGFGDEKLSMRMAVVKGAIPLEQYDRVLNEYNEMLSCRNDSFGGAQGELPGSHMFEIPVLTKQFAEETATFNEWLVKQGKEIKRGHTAMMTA
jgi:ribosomal protein L21